METRMTVKQAYKKEFVNGVYKTIAAYQSLTNEEAKKIRDYCEKIDITDWYRTDKESLEKSLSYGSFKYQYKITDAEVDAFIKGENWANVIVKRLKYSLTI